MSRQVQLHAAPPPGVPAFSIEDDVKAAADRLDRGFGALIAKATLGQSPPALAEAYLDWLSHLAAAPGKQLWLAWKGSRKTLRFARYLLQCALHEGHAPPCIDPLPGDRRFTDPAWQGWPFNAYQQGFLLWQQWMHNATTEVAGVSVAHENIVSFATRQWLDMFAPSNFPLTNPVVLSRTMTEGGANFARGLGYLAEDARRAVALGRGNDARPNPAVGDTVAATPGKVVFRNHLIELIQYTPTTQQVAPEPVLIVPAWIMKYYILDLSAQNSLVRYLVGRGFTVFMISWRNPDAGDRDTSMEDYLRSGVMAAIDAVTAISGSPTLHGTGYCLGGTLLSIAAAAMARDGDTRLKTLSLFAAQQDFTEAGELTLFVNSSELALLDDMMWQQGYLDARQMAGAFQILRSNDLIWSRVIQDYLLGEREAQTDLMAWNADATRMPARMHGEYLRSLFLNNDLAEGRYLAGGAPVAISDIHVPIFVVGTETDHVAPWRSVHKIHLLSDAEVTFVLTSGGHNAGIVSEPGHPRRHFRQLTRAAEGNYIAPDAWMEAARRVDGSWWPSWVQWLENRSGTAVAPPPLGRAEAGYKVLEDAPGGYVLQG
ncbi:MAG: alpha/beta fold hydrolase [Rhodospirillales bacterium]